MGRQAESTSVFTGSLIRPTFLFENIAAGIENLWEQNDAHAQTRNARSRKNGDLMLHSSIIQPKHHHHISEEREIKCGQLQSEKFGVDDTMLKSYQPIPFTQRTPWP